MEIWQFICSLSATTSSFVSNGDCKKREWKKKRRFRGTQESYLLRSDRPTCLAINYSSTIQGSFLSKRNSVKKRPTNHNGTDWANMRKKGKKELIKIHSSDLKFETVWNRSKGVCTRIQLKCNTYVGFPSVAVLACCPHRRARGHMLRAQHTPR